MKSIATGSDFSAVLKGNGKVFSWGRNLSDQLGTSDDINSLYPKKLVYELDAQSNKTSYVYDINGKLKRLTYYKDGERFKKTYSYENNGNLLSKMTEFLGN